MLADQSPNRCFPPSFCRRNSAAHSAACLNRIRRSRRSGRIPPSSPNRRCPAQHSNYAKRSSQKNREPTALHNRCVRSPNFRWCTRMRRPVANRRKLRCSRHRFRGCHSPIDRSLRNRHSHRQIDRTRRSCFGSRHPIVRSSPRHTSRTHTRPTIVLRRILHCSCPLHRRGAPRRSTDPR